METEVALFYSLRNRRPIGIDKHFQMMVIHEDFEKRVKQVIHPNVIWDHLNTMYDMDLLDESTYFPPPLEEDADFALPTDDFGDKVTIKIKLSGAGEVKIEDLEGITTSAMWYRKGDKETQYQKPANETTKTVKEYKKVIKEERKAEKDDKPQKKVKTEVKTEQPEDPSKEKKKPGRKPKTKEGETVTTPAGKESRTSTATPGEKALITSGSAVTGTPTSGTMEKKKRIKKDDKSD